MTRPGNNLLSNHACWLSVETAMEEKRRADKEAEDEDLNEETGYDDLLADFVEFESAGSLDSAATGLQGEGQDVTHHEEPCYPVDGHQGQVFCFHGAYK